ncbi:hypothetical protein THTE_1791 [Thermogutta terrifontis]|uniref:Uncharacterized protein n=1 Tax=Thermogutta terrifontis TaxID=1331910 RepID=A0A286REL8_9BACT|nr:hypothetical protein THTE_1791 [Thermogutta terrifontis]
MSVPFRPINRGAIVAAYREAAVSQMAVEDYRISTVAEIARPD